MEIEVLVKKAKQGDQEALVELIMLQKQEYYKLAYIYMKNNEDTMDAIEDMIVILYEKIHQLKKADSFYSWSKTILVNCCKKQLKNKRRILPLDSISVERQVDDLQKKEDQLVLEEHLARLSEKHQEIIKLRYFLDLDYETIATVLKIPLGTAKSRISVGLKKLKESLGGGSYEKY